MKGVTICDTDPETSILSFDLRDILVLLGADAVRSKWRLKDIECSGATAEDLHRASDSGEVLDGAVLVALAQSVNQIIDGQLSARLPQEEVDWIVIRAIDSSAYDVITDRQDILSTLKSHFMDVRDLPD